MNLIDRSAAVLGDTDSSQRDSRAMSSVDEAFSYLDRYPWHQFTPHVIHPEVQSFVWEVINKRFEKGLVPQSAMAQWKRCCAAPGPFAAAPLTGRDSSGRSDAPRMATNVVNISTKLVDDDGHATPELGDPLGVVPFSFPDVTWMDAKHFRRAVECGLVEMDQNASSRTFTDQVTSTLSEMWPDHNYPIPVVRTVEHVIAVAALARLHLDFGWPKECLACHPLGSSFSITASILPKSNSVHIACCVRKSVDELARLVASMMIVGRGMPLPSKVASDERKTVQRWLQDFRRDFLPLFWAIGPAGEGSLYQISCLNGFLRLNKVADPLSQLTYPGTRCAISGWRPVESAACAR